MDLLEGLRSKMEGGRERERELLFCFGRAEVRKKRQSTVGKEGEGYKYSPTPNGHLSHGSAAVPHCGSASLQVRQCRTTQDSKGKSEV